jgi:hypothetical protein
MVIRNFNVQASDKLRGRFVFPLTSRAGISRIEMITDRRNIAGERKRGRSGVKNISICELQPTDRKRAFPQQDSHTVLLAFSGNHPIQQSARLLLNEPVSGETNMMRNTETLSLQAKVRHAAKHRRIHFRHMVQPELAEPLVKTEMEESQQKKFDFQAAEMRQDPPKSHMRVLLRHAKTHKFIQSEERWTKNPKQARDFHNGWWAAIFAFTMDPRHLVIQYEFDDDRYNLHIPVLGSAST